MAATMLANVAESGNQVPDEITLGEIARRMDRMEQRMEQGFQNATQQIESLAFVSKDTYEVQMRALNERLGTVDKRQDASEESRRWMVRALVTSLLLPVVVAVILALALTQ